MADRKPEFISLMRTIRDVYYKEMGAALDWIKDMTITFQAYIDQVRNPIIGTVETVEPIDDSTLGAAEVTIDLTNPNEMEYSFVIPAGLRGVQGYPGSGVQIVGHDTYANIILKTTASLGDCWVSTDIPLLVPPSGVAQIQDGLTPIIDNPATEADWINVGQLIGPPGVDGLDGTDGSDGSNGESGSQWWTSPIIPTSPTQIPGADLNDFCIVSSADDSINGNYYRLNTTQWLYQGVLNGEKGDVGSLWLGGDGIPSDVLGSEDDYYVDYLSNFYYVKTNGSWSDTPIGSLDGNTVSSIANGGGVSGSDVITGIVSCTQAEFDAGTIDPNQVYIIVG